MLSRTLKPYQAEVRGGQVLAKGGDQEESVELCGFSVIHMQ